MFTRAVEILVSRPSPEVAYRLEAQGDGTRMHFSVTGRPGGFLRLLQPLIARNTQKNPDQAFPRLKQVLEAGTGQQK